MKLRTSYLLLSLLLSSHLWADVYVIQVELYPYSNTDIPFANCTWYVNEQTKRADSVCVKTKHYGGGVVENTIDKFVVSGDITFPPSGEEEFGIIYNSGRSPLREDINSVCAFGGDKNYFDYKWYECSSDIWFERGWWQLKSIIHESTS